MKNILILCPSTGEFSDKPCGKDIYVLAKYLTERYSVHIDILTSFKDIVSSDKMETFYIPTYYDLYHEAVEYYQKEKNLIKKCARKIEIIVRRKTAEAHSVAKYVMNFPMLQRWTRDNISREYNLIISVSHPFYVHQYAQFVFNKMKIKNWCAYFLDPYADNSDTNSNDILQKVREETEIFRQCTNIYTVKEFVENSVNSTVKNYSDKVTIIPTHPMTDKTNTYGLKHKTNAEIHCVFTGMFYETIRNPSTLLEIFSLLPSNFYLHLYSRGCHEIVNRYKDILGDRLILNEYVTDPNQFDEMIHSMDVLINVGNSISNQVPSKILNYFSYGKPIVNLKNCEQDPVECNYSEYSLMKTIRYSSDMESVDAFAQFCTKVKGQYLEWNNIKDLYWTSTLEYVAEQIMSII